MWTLFNTGVTSLEIAFIVALLVAALIGLVNGLFVTRLRIPSFLVTLGMLLVARGTALFITDGFPQRTWSAEGQWLAEALAGDFYVGPFRIYMSLFWFAAAAIILGYLLTQTKAGNWIPGLRAATPTPRAPAAWMSAAPRSACSCCPPRWLPLPASSARSAPRPQIRTAALATSSR